MTRAAALRIQAGEGGSPGLCYGFCFKSSGSDGPLVQSDSIKKSEQHHRIVLGDHVISSEPPKNDSTGKQHLWQMARKPACQSLRAARGPSFYVERDLN